MKSITIFLTSAIFIFAKNALADNYNYKPYIGLDYAYTKTSALGNSPYFNNATIHIGSEYSPYFSTELFLSQSTSYKKHRNEHKSKQSFRSYGLDLFGYLPLDCDHKFSLLATGGIGEYVFNIKNYPQKHHNEHGYGYRFGGGIKYLITPNWHTRLLARYIKFNNVSSYKHANEYTIGIEYLFN